MMTEEQIVEAISWRQRRLKELEQMSPGTEVSCHYPPSKESKGKRHSEFCLCNGTGKVTREVLIDDLICDLEVLHK